MTGSQLVDYLIVTGQIEDINASILNTYEETLIKSSINALRGYKEEVGNSYKMMVAYFNNDYNLNIMLIKFVELVINNGLDDMELKKVLDNITFLVNIGISNKNTILNSYITSLNEAKRNKKLKINEFTIPIGTKHAYYLKTLDNNLIYAADYSQNSKLNISKIVGHRCIEVIDGVKYVIYNENKREYIVVRNEDFNMNRKYYLNRDKDKLKIRFVKYA